MGYNQYMKRFLIATFLFVFSASSAFALSAPGGDPWYISKVVLDQNTFPVGVTFDVSGGIINPSSTPLLLIDNRLPNTGSCADGERCFPTPMEFPPELPTRYAAQFDGHVTVIKFQNSKTYVWIQEEVFTSNDDHLRPTRYAWSWKIPIPHQSEISRNPGNFDSDIDYTHVSEGLLIGYGYEPVGDFPYEGYPGPKIGKGSVGYYMGYKRPENVTVPSPQKISLPMYYNGEKINVSGTIFYTLKPNYRAPEWEWSSSPSDKAKA